MKHKKWENVLVNGFTDGISCIIKRKSNENTLINTVVETVVKHWTSTEKFYLLM